MTDLATITGDFATVDLTDVEIEKARVIFPNGKKLETGNGWARVTDGNGSFYMEWGDDE